MESKLDQLITMHQESAQRLSAIEARNSGVDARVERFWAQEWPRLVDVLDGHEKRLRAVESAVTALAVVPRQIETMSQRLDGRLEDLTRLEGRVTALEKAGEEVEKDHQGILERVGVLERAYWKAVGAGGLLGALVASAPKILAMLAG
ncbi:MAG: hypothetical protein VYE40_07980 [Myxococcota bacterium]|nr:hypothetical protein [Myxococcota bacterium]